MGLGITAVAAVSAEAVKYPFGPYIINCQAPDEGNMHTMLHFATAEQKEKYLMPLIEGKMRSCFSMTEPEVAGSDPTQIQTTAVEDGDEWVINGHKWFTSGAQGADFAIVIARTDPDASIPAGAQLRLHRADATRPASRSSATCRPWAAAAAIRRSATTTCACRKRTCSAAAAAATSSARCASARRGSPTACAGSARSKRRWRCWWTGRRSATPMARCSPRRAASRT